MRRFRSSKPVAPLFGLNADSVARRQTLRSWFFIGCWGALSVVTVLSFYFLLPQGLPRFLLLFLSTIKVASLLFVMYNTAKNKAAAYLADIYELEDENTASTFIEYVAFGNEDKDLKITINEGRISLKDEESPIILIGGPGFVQVNLDSVALLERMDGIPEIIHPRGEAWRLGSFERIREIGTSDEPGKREYAIINLREQFLRGLTVKSRTKDGIPIEVHDIKVLFSILRKPQHEAPANDPYHFQEEAVHTLVYKQQIITPPPPKAAGYSFPWDGTVIPLINRELETLITNRKLSEILASVSIREIDQLTDLEVTNTQMRAGMTSENTAASEAPTAAGAPHFETRTKITSLFFTEDFVKKASDLGIAIHWIDIGTWKLPNELLYEEIKTGRRLTLENAARKRSLDRADKQFEVKAFMELTDAIIVGSFSRASSSSSRKLSEKDYLDLLKSLDNNADVAYSPSMQQRASNNAYTKKDASAIAIEMLKAFRREFIAAQQLMQRETRSPVEKYVELGRIEKALRDIEYHLSPEKSRKP